MICALVATCTSIAHARIAAIVSRRGVPRPSLAHVTFSRTFDVWAVVAEQTTRGLLRECVLLARCRCALLWCCPWHGCVGGCVSLHDCCALCRRNTHANGRASHMHQYVHLRSAACSAHVAWRSTAGWGLTCEWSYECFSAVCRGRSSTTYPCRRPSAACPGRPSAACPGRLSMKAGVGPSGRACRVGTAT